MIKIEIALLMDSFSRAFGVNPPSLKGTSANNALWIYRDFTAACMDIALEDMDVADVYRARLGKEARKLGCKVRAVVPLRSEGRFHLIRFLYRGIGIELAGSLPDDVRFGPCSFARRYEPANCWLMSAFDEGFICGIMGIEGMLRFDCRLTEGATCCRARITHN